MENDELNLDTNQDEHIERNSYQQRIKTLSDKVKQTAQEKEELAKLNAEMESKKSEVEKERDFFKSFNQVSSKYQGASEYQDKIFEKVRSGYEVEDATISILAKEGKLNTPMRQVENETIAGGSAGNTLVGSDKTPTDMSQDERRSALLDADKKGELEQILRRGL